MPGGLSPREACQSAAEEALLADYRPLRAGFAEDYIDSGDEVVDGVIGFDIGNGIMQFQVDKPQLVELLKILAGRNINMDEMISPEKVENEDDKNKLELTSTRRKRYTKMKIHKRRKL